MGGDELDIFYNIVKEFVTEFSIDVDMKTKKLLDGAWHINTDTSRTIFRDKGATSDIPWDNIINIINKNTTYYCVKDIFNKLGGYSSYDKKSKESSLSHRFILYSINLDYDMDTVDKNFWFFLDDDSTFTGSLSTNAEGIPTETIDLLYKDEQVWIKDKDIIKEYIGKIKDKEDEKLNKIIPYVTSTQLAQMKFENVNVADLNRVLKKYNINTIERIRHFLAQCAVETGWGAWLLEKKDKGVSREDYFRGRDTHLYNSSPTPGEKDDGAKYSGAGYLQLTWKENYSKFANYIDDQDVLKKGAGYVATTYPWESAGWYWSIFKKINSNITTVKEVTQLVNGGDTGLLDRKVKYDTIKGIITE